MRSLPKSRLREIADIIAKNESDDVDLKEYFFDRHPGAFQDVLQYHRCGSLHVNSGLCGNLLLEEFQFWKIDLKAVEPCCWSAFSRNLYSVEDFRKLDDLFDSDVMHGSETCSDKLANASCARDRISLLLRKVFHSKLAKIFATASSILTAVSMLLFVMESHYTFNVAYLANGSYVPVTDPTSVLTGEENASNLKSDDADAGSSVVDYHPYLRYADHVLFAYFLVEYVIRITVSPKKLSFLVSPLNIADLLSLCGQLAAILQTTLAINRSYWVTGAGLAATRFIRMARLLRLFSIVRHRVGYRVLAHTLRTSPRELALVFACLSIGILVFAGAIHYAERDTFPSIPYGCWWALITMTTVGYGDVYPKSSPGYLVGSLCAVTGVLIVAFTLPVMTANFSTYYSYAYSRQKFRSASQQRPSNMVPQPAGMGCRIFTIQCALATNAGVGSLDLRFLQEPTLFSRSEYPAKEFSYDHLSQPYKMDAFYSSNLLANADIDGVLLKPDLYNVIGCNGKTVSRLYVGSGETTTPLSCYDACKAGDVVGSLYA